MNSRTALLVVSLLLATAGSSPAQPNFVLQASVIASGAVSGQSDNFKIMGTVGQPAIGSGMSDNYKGAWGFWHGFSSLSASGVFADLHVFLEGPYSGTSMTAALGTDLALSQPFSGPPWNYAGSESVASGFPGSHPNVVDWVYVQVRAQSPGPASPPMSVVAERAGFVTTDGTIVDTDGVSALAFPSLSAGTYYVVVDHRNHIRAMSASGVASASDTLSYDFTDAMAKAYTMSPAPMKSLAGGNFGLFAGDANDDGQILTDDFNMWLAKTKLGATGYLNEDFNLDTQALTDDFNTWLANTKLGASSQVPNP